MKLTQHKILHLNGGSKYSQSNYEILADGKPTGIVLVERTNGRPHYRYTARELHHGDEVLDLMTKDGPDPVAWIRERVTPKEASSESE